MLHRSQIFLGLLLAFLVGVGLGSFWEISQTVVLGALLVCVLMIALFFRRGSSWLNAKFTLGAFLMLFLLFGSLRYNLTHNRYHLLEKFAEGNSQLKAVSPKNRPKVTLSGYITAPPESSNGKQKLIFYSQSAQSGGKVITTDERVLITASGGTYHYGQTVQVTGELLLPKNPDAKVGAPTGSSGLPDSDFDYVNYLAKDGIYTVLYYPVIQPISLELGLYQRVRINIYQSIFAIKDHFVTAISQSLPEPYAAYINGVLLGARAAVIPTEVKTTFARTGTSHILAISGYNITMIAWVLSGFFLWFFRRQTAFWFTLAGLAVFVILTGAQASVIRAAVMGAIGLFAYRQGRLYRAQNGIVLAAALMVLLNPEILRYDVGFQLSFTGTLGLVYVGPVLQEKLTRLPKLRALIPERGGLRETLLMTTSAQIFVLPLLLYYFKTLSLVTLPANLLVLPLIPYTMALGFATGLAGILWPLLGQIIGYLTWLPAWYEVNMIGWLAAPRWATVTVVFPWSALVGAYLLLALWLGYSNLKKPLPTATL